MSRAAEVLVLSGSEGGGWHAHDLERAGRELGVRVAQAGFRDLEVRLGLRRGTAEARLSCGPTDIDDLDALIVRTMPAGSLEQIIFRMDVLLAAEAAGVRVLNPPRSLEAAIDKHLATARLEAAGLPVPPTRVTERADRASAFFDELGGDVVLKPIFGSEGNGQERLRDARVAHERFTALEAEGAVLYLQQFVESPGHDLRVLVARGRPIAAMRRLPAPGEWQTNIACGGRAERIEPSDEMVELATRAGAALGTVVAGVDLLPDTSGGLSILEVNGVPGWRTAARVCGVDVARVILEEALARTEA